MHTLEYLCERKDQGYPDQKFYEEYTFICAERVKETSMSITRLKEVEQ